MPPPKETQPGQTAPVESVDEVFGFRRDKKKYVKPIVVDKIYEHEPKLYQQVARIVEEVKQDSRLDQDMNGTPG